MRNKQVVLLIAGISGIVTGIIVSLNIPFIRQGLFYPASPVEIVVSLSLTFSVSVVFFVGAIVGWISVSERFVRMATRSPQFRGGVVGLKSFLSLRVVRYLPSRESCPH